MLEEDALRDRLDDSDEDEARLADKSLESALTEDIDGYILIARQHDGWDAARIVEHDPDLAATLAELLSSTAVVLAAWWGGHLT